MTDLPAVATALRCEYLENPLAIDAAAPRLSWEMACDAPGAAQSAYRVIAADSKDALKRTDWNLWDSGKVDSNQSLHVHYAGKALASCQQVFWKVMLWDEAGRAGRWSKPATFTMGMLDRSEWKGEWIGNYLGNTHTSPLLRKEFSLRGKVKRALFHATACGIYHLTLNGKTVHDDLFAPGWTDFKKRRYYRCYDLTRQLQRGDRHCLGAELGDGWYREWYTGWGNKARRYGANVTLLGQLRIEYADGAIEIAPTDTSWTSILGPTTQSGFYYGESVDAQLEPKGWERVGFDEKGWSAAVSRPDGGQDVPFDHRPVSRYAP